MNNVKLVLKVFLMKVYYLLVDIFNIIIVLWVKDIKNVKYVKLNKKYLKNKEI